jgi:hypothetical protein
LLDREAAAVEAQELDAGRGREPDALRRAAELVAVSHADHPVHEAGAEVGADVAG